MECVTTILKNLSLQNILKYTTGDRNGKKKCIKFKIKHEFFKYIGYGKKFVAFFPDFS